MYASGGNYRIEIAAGVVQWTVWARPDLDSQSGARLAEEQVAHSGTLALGAPRALCFDVSEAPSVMGPRTQAAIGSTLAPWERVRKPVAVVLSDNALQRLQWERIVREVAPRVGRLFIDRGHALAYLAQAIAGQGTSAPR